MCNCSCQNQSCCGVGDAQGAHHHHHASPFKEFCKEWMAPLFSLLMLAAGMIMGWSGAEPFASSPLFQIIWYVIAVLPVGLPVVFEAVEEMAKKDIFNEFTLMSLASIGAFVIGEYPEAVGVMLFYSVGEKLQDRAVDKATRDISNLASLKVDKARLVAGGKMEEVAPETVKPGDVIEVRPGERIPLDGVVISEGGTLDTSALTGESMPRPCTEGGEVLAGMISIESSLRIRVSRNYGQSALSRIMEMVREASERKAPAELFIRKFSRIYTQAVIILAVLIVALPALYSLENPDFDFVFASWLKRALVFLVISCPCALVISVPLSYFAGIGAASRNGILFKGGNYLDALSKVKGVAFDKTGTLTTGRFSVEKVCSSRFGEEEFLKLAGATEAVSSHPLAKALTEYVKNKGIEIPQADKVKERPGFGVEAMVGGHKVMAGNALLLEESGISLPEGIVEMPYTVILCAVDGMFAGYVAFADTLKPDAKTAVSQLENLGIENIAILSGDRQEPTARIASLLGISEAYGQLLPAGKVEKVREMAEETGGGVAFVGDGMNDSPVLAASNVGVAMGDAGSDMAVEAADVVIRTDSPSKLASAIRISRFTRKIVGENIFLAIAIKVIILVLGVIGIASLWAAVFADVGVALIVILNSMRIIHNKKF